MSVKTEKKAASPETLEAALDRCVRNAGEKMTLQSAYDAVCACVPNEQQERVERDIRLILDEDRLIFSKADELNVFYPRQYFFKDKTFRVTQFDIEKKNKILIPGGRAAPFCHHAVLPSGMTLLTPDGKKLPRKTIEMSVEDAASYYNLLGSEEMFHYFEADHPDNTAVLMRGDPAGILKLDVFSVASLGNPDAVLLRVKDWLEGVFEVTAASAGDMKKQPLWLSAMEKALCRVFETEGQYLEIPDQIAMAFWDNPEILTAAEPFESDRLLATSDLIEIILTGSRTILWRNDEERPLEDTAAKLPDGIAVSSGVTDSAEDILEELKCPVTMVEIIAGMYDECYRGGRSFESVYDRLFACWNLEFNDEAQEVYFRNYLEAEWENVCDDYDRVRDHDTGRVRHFAIGVNNERLHWLAKISRSETELTPKQHEILHDLGEMSLPVLRLLAGLNEHADLSDQTEADALVDALTLVADRSAALMQQFETPES